MFFFQLASICSLFSLVLALPVVSPVEDDVWVPVITYPDANTIWVAGGTYTVTWNTAGEPLQITNPAGALYLRHDGQSDSILIGDNFPLSAGEATVTIPTYIEPSTSWIVNLFGDSGDWSPPFTINAPW